ncbi:cellulose synthase/poly-beta-1,6-N-acetylglucosamine synthase-like glycosyltransferase [Rhodovulum bhavnagarense]|uniref:Cellulose synthase/poly-beta-1,6-N-acetylglucosamine synthase-like glycosyltransferase n=1 Tax=Rhodovulum bhavnagarense TaxID=992286 RepID=A0A4R2RBJ4_9RHOB|nr:glycosyltransferase [Rhodovulum bhavnagarense]TCP60710.1 cellulose synthase/poly-beta-1,6-N-acetylglucosamine synthase-like glycosyltransferase [Rhodovulum bhavnagarense]
MTKLTPKAARPMPARAPAIALPGDLWLGDTLLRMGAITPAALNRTLADKARMDIRLDALLVADGTTDGETLVRALCRRYRTTPARPDLFPPDRGLVDMLGAARCLREGFVPLRRMGAATLIATAHPERFGEQTAALPAGMGTPVMLICSERMLQDTLARHFGPALALAAATRVPEVESCRFWYGAAPRVAVAAILVTLICLFLLAPRGTLAALTVWAAGWMALGTGLKAAGAIAEARHAARLRRQPEPPPPVIARLPVVSILVPLYHEAEVATRLIERLAQLDYPRALLDICLVTEANDDATRAMLARTELPGWMRTITVPDGILKTKPRALNYALEFCRGSIIGVYDAEDAPEPDQIHRMVTHFHARGADVACLQGRLDFYNTGRNWLSRCFTMEYAAWFRVVLPGLARLGVPVPLGGTTLFFRRPALEALGGWDAHNVTEDADLGLRLARHGYRTEFLDSVTAEEANCRTWPWVRQRSRWLKGYAMTWSAHMREPVRLWRQLGPWGFWGVQILFLGSLTQVALMPLLWSFWGLALGLDHPLAAHGMTPALATLISLFILSETVSLSVGIQALRRSGKPGLIPWLPTLHFYFPLATLALYKAIWEMIARPFFWDKTRHGID